ncbi:MAG: tRNA-dihydrouridine synthase, partial [Candidatus Neomarinimicrobiota bacterium]|nr:tRNA-dihydrouridine synthase [Candidatus Neomarinimicrobiota bacterium]
GEPNPAAPSLSDIAHMCSRHFDLLLENRGERTGSNLMRKHFSNYIKGFPGASIFRQKLVTAPGLAEMRSALNEFMEAAQNVEFELV